jgi:hypothetical protein
MRRILTFVVVAAAGLAAAVGVTIAATAITDQEIGLDSEPLTAGRELAPPEAKRPARTNRDRPRTAPQPARTTTQPARTTSTPSTPPPGDDEAEDESGDDSGGHGRGRGRGRGRGGDDDD